MLMQLPRLTSSLRDPFDIDQAYLHRKSILQQNLKPRISINESELERKIVDQWDQASPEVRQVYKQFIGAVVELIDGEVPSEEFREVALTAYRLFAGQGPGGGEDDVADIDVYGKKFEVQKLIGHTVLNANLQKVAVLARKLFGFQSNNHVEFIFPEHDANGTGDEFGANLVFHAPSRFLVDVTLEDKELQSFKNVGASFFHDESSFDYSDYSNNHFAGSGGNFDLVWLRGACDQIVRESTSQLPRDDLAMAICRVLDSDKPGEEIAGDLLDLVGDSAFETVQNLILHRKELVDAICCGKSVLKTDKMAPNARPRMPSYGTQVTVQTESEKQIDKLRRKEEK